MADVAEKFCFAFSPSVSRSSLLLSTIVSTCFVAVKLRAPFSLSFSLFLAWAFLSLVVVNTLLLTVITKKMMDVPGIAFSFPLSINRYDEEMSLVG